MTGAELARQLCDAAWKAKTPVSAYLAPLTSDRHKFIARLRGAKNPKPSTIERVHALLEGRPVPPPPTNNFQSSGGGQALRTLAVDQATREKRGIEQRIELARRAHAEKQPGETLNAATKRLEAEMQS